ncbi:Sulfide:quinone oxidoreductase, mitochondrial [Geodia barretti]|uniref:Sulfide:quinone oxidoreductase, mitochondrial n=2 Tax=Geodia barretti TaxID=519541 RepID=A0AA35WLX1_GEOBA|nr:Sulfide:quinone oxidoreductase, mitochondrial [Geodia barretti]
MQLHRLSLRQKTIAMSAAVFRLLGERSLQRAPTAGALRIAAPAATARSLHVGEPSRVADKSYKFVVCGAGPGGLAVASSLGRRFGEKSIAIIEPADYHYYQPMWTLVGCGIKTLEDSRRKMADFMPPQADWLQTSVTGFRPNENIVETADGSTVKYDYLIVAVGLQIDYGKIKGLPEALEDPNSMVSTNYSSLYAPKTFENVRRFKGGHALFTFPTIPIKCPGAPQKIMYLAEDYWRRNGMKENTKISFNTTLGVIFPVKKYADVLQGIVKERGITVNYQHKLLEVLGDKREAVFELLAEDKQGETITVPYDFLHATPPMAPLDFMVGQPISDQLGWVDVDPKTLQHKKYANIFSLGDCSSVPTSKTAAAVAAESRVLKRNLLEVVKGGSPRLEYDGYTSCPLITSMDKAILAEFDFNVMPLETFPIDQGPPRRWVYRLKKDFMPGLYWHMLLRGWWGGPGFARKLMHLGDHSK